MFLTWFEYISWFKKKFAEELSEVKEELNSKWNKIFKKWKTVTAHDYSRGEDDVEDEDDEDRHPMNKNKLEYKSKDQRNKHFEGSCELLSLNLILMLTSC